MLVAHVADTHISERAQAASIEEQVEWLTAIGEDADERGARVILHAGDVYDSASTPLERQAAARVLARWAELMPIIIVRGNHDRAVDLDILARLSTRCPVIVHERPEPVRIGDALVCCLPWPRKAELVAALGSTSANEVHQVASAAMRAVLAGFRVACQDHHGPRILLGHLELGTALSDSGQPLAGRCDIELSESDLLDVGADYVALGHIHKRQTLADRLHYPGAYRSATFGEAGEKGYSLVTVERGRPPAIEFRPSGARKLVTIECTTDSRGIPHWDAPPDVEGAAVRLVYEIAEGARATAAAHAREAMTALVARGASSVRVDARVVTTTRVRSEDIRAARTNADRVEAWWKNRGERPARATEVLGKLSRLEAEVLP